MGNHPVNTEVDPQALAQAQSLWHKFTTGLSWCVGASAVTLILMAIFLT